MSPAGLGGAGGAAAATALWRPWCAPNQPAPLRLQRGDGARVTDVQGRQYLDAAGGLWNVALGQHNTALIARMRAQLDALSFGSLFHATHAPAEQLAQRLVGLVGGSAHSVYLSTTGSTAVEVALRVARLHQRAQGRAGKTGVVSFDRAYHGSSLMGLSAGGLLRDELAASGEALPGFFHIPSPPHESAALAALAALLAQHGAHIACLLVEPVLGSAGVLVPSAGFCAALGALCQQHQLLLVADEVATGAGRCGAFLASQRLGLQPDIVALSKGINSGYFPLGCTVMSRAVVEPIAARGWTLAFGSTQDGNPVGCVAALATLDQIEQAGLCQRAESLGQRMAAALRERTPPERVREVRGLGLMLGIELMHGDAAATPFTAAESDQVRRWCQEEGLLVYHFDSGLSLFPPLTLTDDEADEMLDILADVLNRLP